MAEKYPRSAYKPNQGPTVEWFGGDCPVAPGTPISVMFRSEWEMRQRGYGAWRGTGKPEKLDWKQTGGYRDILAYYERVPVPAPPQFGVSSKPSPAAENPPLGTVQIPSSRIEALAMKAVAEIWLAEDDMEPTGA